MFQYLKDFYRRLNMNMKSCDNGHYYNQDKNSECPYCNKTSVNLPNIGSDESEHTQMVDIQTTKDIEKLNLEDDETTMMLSTPSKLPKEDNTILKMVELAGWIVIISEKGKGSVYNITYGMNIIGRAKSNEISIDNNDISISREKHSSIIYDFENNLFFIQHYDGKYLTYLNGKMVVGLTQLKAYDKIKIGKTEFIFVPLCGDSFKWEDNEN